MTWIEAIIIAIVEGLTEFLPVSSTGHMIITGGVMGLNLQDSFIKAFVIIIQFSAILSVVVLYWKRFFRLNQCVIFDQRTKEAKGIGKIVRVFKNLLYKFDFYWKLFIAFLPAAFFGLLFSDKIDALLEKVDIIALMLVLGGVFMLFVDKIFNKEKENQAIDEKRAVRIGLFQCLAMIPGVSRSMASIVGGMSQGLSRKNAAEFSFFLAVPTMFAATAYKLVKEITNPESRAKLIENIDILIIGNIVSFIVALLAIKFFISFVNKYGFKAFGYYRIIIGGTILALSYFKILEFTL